MGAPAFWRKVLATRVCVGKDLEDHAAMVNMRKSWLSEKAYIFCVLTQPKNLLRSSVELCQGVKQVFTPQKSQSKWHAVVT